MSPSRRKPARSKPARPAQPGEEPPDLWKVIQRWVWRRFGWVGLVIITICVASWSQRDLISKLLGIEPLVAHLSEKSLPTAEPGKFNIAVAHLEGDDDHSKERVIRDSLHDKFPIVNAKTFDRLISSEPDEDAGHNRALALLKTSGFDVMIWGDYLPASEKVGESRFRLHLTVSRETKMSSPGRYRTTEDLNLPPLFWQDLTEVLGLLVATSETEFPAYEGRYHVDKLMPFIDRVRTLLQSTTANQWNADTRTSVQFVLANALWECGDQSGKNEPLREAITVYGEVLKRWTREKMPLDWALTQNNLGGVLAILGGREVDPALLNEAVAAFREALKEYTREKVPLDWAMTQNNLGVALDDLGEHQLDPAQINEAVAAFREALKEYTRAKVPLDWAMTQNNLGIALKNLGTHWKAPALIRESVAVYREALKERTREKVPLDWAATQNNLGVSLNDLGERGSNPALLREAVAAYREALKERTREKVALDWAMTQNNLGVALMNLGRTESDPRQLEEAAHALQDALLVFRAEKDDYYTDDAETNFHHLQEVQKQIGQQKNAKGVARETTK